MDAIEPIPSRGRGKMLEWLGQEGTCRILPRGGKVRTFWARRAEGPGDRRSHHCPPHPGLWGVGTGEGDARAKIFCLPRKSICERSGSCRHTCEKGTSGERCRSQNRSWQGSDRQLLPARQESRAPRGDAIIPG